MTSLGSRPARHSTYWLSSFNKTAILLNKPEVDHAHRPQTDETLQAVRQ
jgi:hypothetical protein